MKNAPLKYVHRINYGDSEVVYVLLQELVLRLQYLGALRRFLFKILVTELTTSCFCKLVCCIILPPLSHRFQKCIHLYRYIFGYHFHIYASYAHKIYIIYNLMQCISIIILFMRFTARYINLQTYMYYVGKKQL